MGGVEVLQPQDLFNHRHRLRRNYHTLNRVFSASPMKSQSVPSANSGPAVARSLNRRKRSPPKETPALPRVNRTKTLPLREKDTNKTTKNHKNTAKPATDLVSGTIKILKRGEVLPTSSAKQDVSPKKKKKKKEGKVGATTSGALNDLVVLSSSTDALAPEPDVAPKNIRISEFYAGSAFVTSPEPSSLPMPVFSKKKEDVLVDDDGRSNTNYDATTDLRRLLRLDLS